jgi:hypothetical protein
MYTVIETETFQSRARQLLERNEWEDLVAYVAKNPRAGDVVPGSGGCRKLRWALPGRGKSGGARVIYINFLDDGLIYLLSAYAKNVEGNIPAHLLRAMKETISESRLDDR